LARNAPIWPLPRSKHSTSVAFNYLGQSVCLSVCPLIKSILYKYKATDGYGETSNEHVTEGHTVIVLIINKPNMASVRTWVWIYCSCSWKGLTV